MQIRKEQSTQSSQTRSAEVLSPSYTLRILHGGCFKLFKRNISPSGPAAACQGETSGRHLMCDYEMQPNNIISQFRY